MMNVARFSRLLRHDVGMGNTMHIVKDFLVALFVVLLAWAAQWLLKSFLNDRVPFITFFPAMFVLAWWGGFRPTLIGTILSGVILSYAILEPINSFKIAGYEYQIGFVIYMAVSLAIGWLGEKVMQSKLIAKQATENALNEGKQLRVNVANRVRAEEALVFLSNASTSLAALVDRESALQQAARLPIPFLADWCVVYVVDQGENIEYHAHAHVDPEKDQILGEMLSKFPLDWNSNTATVRALKTGQSQLLENLSDPQLQSFTQTGEHLAMVALLKPHAVISVPLKIRERIIGVIGLVACDPLRHYTQREVALAESLAQRVAVAVDNARLFHAVKEASRQKDEFLAMLAHELRNPLAAIRYAVTLGQMSPDESTEEMFGVIDRQTGNLAHLIDDLLDVSRISRDKITLQLQNADVRSLIEGVTAAVRPTLDEKRHELILEIPEENIVVHVDPTRAEQILANLLLNAAKYTNPSGCITIRVFTEPPQAIIQVIDTGVGLTQEMLQRVFDLFAQADRSLDRSQGGLGIGLTVARKLAEMHGGTIEAESEGLGRGATFTVRLPLAESAVVAEVPTAMNAHCDLLGRRRVLVVDDNRDTATSCAQLFHALGHDVRTAFDGFEAIEVAHSFRPEVIFLDIGLPGMNGYDVAKTLRKEGFNDESIIAVTGYGQPEDRQRSDDAGFDEHLVKPVQQDALVSVLRRVAAMQETAS